MKSGVYKITNAVSGKIYIGSAADVRGRWAAHRSALSRGVHENRFLQAAWKKHGPQAFLFEVIEHALEDDLHAREQYWIDALPCRIGGGGYNISPSAGTCRGVKHSAEARARMSAAKKGKPSPRRGIPQSEETRARQKASHKLRAQKPDWAAKHAKAVSAAHSKEAREKRSASKRGRPLPEATRAKMSAAHRAFWSESGPEQDARRETVAGIWKGKARPEHSAALKGKPRADRRSLSYETAEEIRARKSQGASYSELEGEYGLNRSSLFRIVHRETYASPD